MHLVDTLRVGGDERVAVNLSNLLPRTGYRTHLRRHEARGRLPRWFRMGIAPGARVASLRIIAM